jgi:uncharacterized membrane protein (DUF441 family)
MIALRYVYLLALVAWLGGMVVLGAVVAPSTFHVLQVLEPQAGRQLAGEVFGTALARFHYVSYAAAGLMIVSLAAMGVLGPRPRPFLVRGLLIGAMLGIALYSGGIVANQIAVVQQEAGGLPSRLPPNDTRRIRFDQLHVLSERLMMVNVVGALALLFWEAQRE